MAIIPTNNISKTYKNEYLVWRDDKNFQEAKRQEYLRQNPDFISDYDLQRAKILLYAVDMMDRSVSVNSDHINTIVEGSASVGLGYSAISGAATGHLIQKTKFVQKHIDKFVQKIPKSKNFIPMTITTISGVLGVVTSYPIYAFFSNLQSKIDRKKRFDTMEKELKDPKIFSTLTPEQRVEFEKNLANLEKFDKSKTPKVVIEKSVKSVKKTVHEVLNYDKEQTKFRQKYEEDKSYYDKDLTEQEIRNAKKDKVLLCVLTREINTKSQSYAEKMQRITDNVITFSFAFGSLLSLGYERIARNLKWNKSSLPAGMGILLMLTSTFFATWAQSRASHIGRFKAKQELMQNPERLVYISKRRTNTVDENNVQVEDSKSVSMWQFMKEFFKDNKEYEVWKKKQTLAGHDISKAMETINFTPEQLEDGNRLKTNMFKTFYKIDTNTQNYSSKVDIAREAIKYPTMLLLGSAGSLFGMKHLVSLRNAISPKEVFKASAKYVGTISLFTLPTLFINSYFAKVKKMAARISDMQTMNELEDYRFFADYSKYKDVKSI